MRTTEGPRLPLLHYLLSNYMDAMYRAHRSDSKEAQVRSTGWDDCVLSGKVSFKRIDEKDSPIHLYASVRTSDDVELYIDAALDKVVIRRNNTEYTDLVTGWSTGDPALDFHAMKDRFDQYETFIVTTVMNALWSCISVAPEIDSHILRMVQAGAYSLPVKEGIQNFLDEAVLASQFNASKQIVRILHVNQYVVALIAHSSGSHAVAAVQVLNPSNGDSIRIVKEGKKPAVLDSTVPGYTLEALSWDYVTNGATLEAKPFTEMTHKELLTVSLAALESIFAHEDFIKPLMSRVLDNVSNGRYLLTVTCSDE